MKEDEVSATSVMRAFVNVTVMVDSGAELRKLIKGIQSYEGED